MYIIYYKMYGILYILNNLAWLNEHKNQKYFGWDNRRINSDDMDVAQPNWGRNNDYRVVSKVLAQGIGGSIILIIILHIIINILSSIVTGQYEKDIDDERDKIFELYALQISSVIFGISLVITLVLLGWFNLTITSGLIVITFSGFIGSIVSLFFKIYLYR